MDPGYKLLQHIKTVPNLINEDPSIVTPKNSSFLDLPWNDLSKLLASRQEESQTHKRRTSNASVETASTSSEADLGNWDSMTGYQDALHTLALKDPLGEKIAKLATCHNAQETFTLLHDTVTQFEDDGRYKNDVRYTQLWLQYANRLADPGWVYDYMLSKGIGKYVALFYEEAAKYYAVYQSLEKAKSTLNHGIQNNAEPVDHLHHLLQYICSNRISYNATKKPIVGEKHKIIRQVDDHLPRAVVTLLDVIDSQLARDARRAMLQQCYKYHVETSFEEIRARWPKRNIRQSTSAAGTVTGGALRTGHPNTARPAAFITKPLSSHAKSASLLNRFSYDGNSSRSYTHNAAQNNKRPKLTPRSSSTAILAKRPIILNKEPSVILPSQVQLQQQPTIKGSRPSSYAYPHPIPPINEKISSQFATTSHEESSITDILSKPIEMEFPGLHARDLSNEQQEENNTVEISPNAGVQKEVKGAIKHQVSAKVESGLSIVVSNMKSAQLLEEIMAIPCEAKVIKQLLDQVDNPPVTEYKGYHDMHEQKQKPQPVGKFDLGTIRYTMKRKLGEGGTASVYELKGSLALKVESVMCNAWEFYIMRQAAQRCKEPSHVVTVHSYYGYNMTSFMVMDLAKHGTLLDILNEHRLKHLTSAMAESRALGIIIELLDALCDLHAAGIIHGDVKMENVVVVESSTKGDQIAFIDFGRAMDLTLVSPNVRIYPRWRPVKPGTIDPPISPPWLPWALDYWGLAGIAHWLLFGHQIRVHKVAQPKPRWVLKEHIKRYWHKTFWDDFFDKLMNPSTAATTSATPAHLLAAARKLVL
ncbi:hypothetical protein K492DRAFT_211693 [Lichtheimia hyalospora FSU 10163]|nr:hypothetical protein K492DRAFT_211693 [Lichtheimia hyalospora FSU 10163]